MDYDAVLLVETPNIVSRFYPITLTQPLPLLIVGGFRLVEHVATCLSRGEVNIIICTRDYLCSVNWKRNIKSLLTEELTDRKIVLEFTTLNCEALYRLLSKYDKVLPLPANTLKIKDLSRLEIVRPKDVSEISEFLRVVWRNEIHVITLSYIYDVIMLNIDVMREMFQRLNIGNSKLVLEAEIDTNAKVEKMCVLYRCRVQPFSHIRSGTVAYPESVIGGEVKNSIISEFVHKEHYGYVGDSYIGRFVNLGAGTTFSNLKNTRGVIKVLGKSSGMTKLGALVGDHVKTAIGTLIYSGKTVGPYSHIYDTVDTDVPPLTIYRKGKCQIMDIDRLVEQIRRWCHKYDIDLESEIAIATSLYRYFKNLLNEVRFYELTLSLK